MQKRRKPLSNEVEEMPVGDDEEESSDSDAEEVEEQEDGSDPEGGGNEEEKAEESDSEDFETQDELSQRESIRSLLQPFGKDQLIDLLKIAATKNRSVAKRVIAAAESDTVHRKLFVHGLGWDATNETLQSTFKVYGPIEECNVVTDKVTGKSKGYGFVLFKTREGASKALEQPQKKVGVRTIACQLASFGPMPAGAAEPTAGRKIFVKNVPPNADLQRLQAFFSRYGEIEGGPVGCGRGFAIFTYKTAEACRKALEEPIKDFEGCQLNCQRAFEKAPVANKPAASTPLAGLLQPNDLALAYNSAALLSLNPAAVALVGQNPALVGGGLSPTVNRSSTTASVLGVGLGSVGQSGINSIGNYGSQAALQGLGAYHSTQLGQSSTSTRSHPSYLGR